MQLFARALLSFKRPLLPIDVSVYVCVRVCVCVCLFVRNFDAKCLGS